MSQCVVFFGGRKGVSPLIATVLLIAFAVALGAVIMNWGRGFVQERTADVDQTTKIETGCALDVQMKVTERSTRPQLCYGGSGTSGFLDFTLENIGKKDIKRVDARVDGSLGIYINNSLNNSKMTAGVGATRQNLTYSYTDYGSVQQVIFTPIIDIAGSDNACSGSAVKKDISEIRNCSAS